MMNQKIFAFIFFFAIFGVISTNAQAQEQQGSKIIFFVQHEVEQPDDYVEISIQIKSQNPSLEKAINEAQNIVTQVQNIVNKYCETHSKNKKDCENAVQTSQYKINPIYQLVRKVPTFVAFSVIHQTVAKIKDVKDIGKLADDILKSGVSKINSFEWKPLEQLDIEDQVISEGMELVNRICDNIGMQLGRIIAVSEVSDYDNEQEEQKPAQKQGEQQEEEEQEEEEEEPIVVYKFEIICKEKGKNKK